MQTGPCGPGRPGPIDLPDAVAAVFAANGPLAQIHARYRPREGQLQMARAVAETLVQGGKLVVEAGTGVGKTYAYLVPVLLSGERVLVSTATKALQDQLFYRDLPALKSALGIPVRMALLKGRTNYLCLHRLAFAEQGLSWLDPPQARVLDKVRSWAQSTTSGDLNELPEWEAASPWEPLVTSTQENCLGTACPRWNDCHFVRARRQAMSAELVVVNHHLFFSDLLAQEPDGLGGLPLARVVVLDEAHQLNDIGGQFLGRQCSTGQLRALARDALAVGQRLAPVSADWAGLALCVEQAAKDVRQAIPGEGKRLHWRGRVPDVATPQAWWQALQGCARALHRLHKALETVADMAPDLQQLQRRTQDLYAQLALFADPCPDGRVRWLEASVQLQLRESPVDLAVAQAWTEPGLRAGAQAPATVPQAVLGHIGKAWIFTSATLGEGEGLEWFVHRAGIGSARVLRVPSPFDYPAQSAVHVPADLPLPSDPAHAEAVAYRVAQAARRLGGKTLVLTTTLRAMREIAEHLQQICAADGLLEVLVQSQWPRQQMVARFREGNQEGRPGCILVASSTFWEGFDVPGEALQLVVIDKLPFPPPGDPLVAARVQQIVLAGGSPFSRYYLPETAMALRQGAGRLIRSETDQGLLLIADTRLRTKPYGERLFAALPPMRRIGEAAAWDQALEALVTKTSTTISPVAP